HKRACALARVQPFTLYTFRHTCLTRWAAHMDPYTLAYLAGHSDFGMTRRYVHPQADTVRAAMERAQAAGGGHSFGHSGAKADTMLSPKLQIANFKRFWSGRVDSNHRPPGPEPGALARLSHAPNSSSLTSRTA